MANRWCKHYRARFYHDTCNAGVAYADFMEVRPLRFPCFESHGCPEKCALVEFPTPEEEALKEAELQELLARIGIVRTAIVEATGGKWDVAGEIPCPCCEGGTVRYGVSGYNGHMRAGCSTPHCVSWQE